MQFIKNNSTRIVIIILSLVLITCCSVGATFAKYTTVAEGSSVARVAKWSVLARENGKGGSEVYVGGASQVFVNIFKYLEDTDTADGTTENDVADPADKNIIAPGTKGKFAFDIINNSEVSAEYTVVFAENNPEDVPIEYSLDGTDWVDNVDALNNMAHASEPGKKALVDVPLAIQNGEDTVTIHWRWVFERGNDTNDTQLGIEQPEVSLTVTLTVDQVD
ncbi:MAG: hypothetical protein IJY01_01835 [Clostridia bacterium]|nr:hypothetical protein [Clostridia bacterium]